MKLLADTIASNRAALAAEREPERPADPPDAAAMDCLIVALSILGLILLATGVLS